MGRISIKTAGFIVFVFCIPIVSSLLFSGCEETECSESAKTALYVNFYKKSNHAEHTDTLSVRGLTNDSLLYEGVAKKTLELPLRINADTTIYVFSFLLNAKDSIVNDTVTFIHRNNEHFISEACGCAMFYVIEDVYFTRGHIDSISVQNKTITNEIQENIRIFF